MVGNTRQILDDEMRTMNWTGCVLGTRKAKNVKRIFVVKHEDYLKALGADGRIILKRTLCVLDRASS